MPLNVAYRKQVTESVVADLINVGGRSGGACTAAIFLKEFVHGLTNEVVRNGNEGSTETAEEEVQGYDEEDADATGKVRYAHIDIAGVMDTTEASGYSTKGMTGRPTRSLIEFARRLG